jgi:predicted nucleotidyltransferase component of viral defense system
MSGAGRKNIAASVRQRLLNRGSERGEAFDLVLVRFGLERFLYRLSQSRHRDQFVLKGALLFELWSRSGHRPTRDLDLEGLGENNVAAIKRIFREIMVQPVEDDGLICDLQSLRVARIKEAQEYEGLRINFVARLERARIPMQVDVGFGDVIVPAPVEVEYPVMLDLPRPVLRAYSRETVIAEKLEAAVRLGMVNTRMKDFYDLWKLPHDFEFAGSLLSGAIQATFRRRRTSLPDGIPVALTEEFSRDPQKTKQWQAFIKKGSLDDPAGELSQVVLDILKFVGPVIEAVRKSEPLHMSWHPGGPWLTESITPKN